MATKYTNAAPGNDPNAAGNHRKSMMQALEASFKRLKTDYIDLYWLHIWDQLTPIEEVMRAFDDLVRQGKILYAGVSDMPAWVVAQGQYPGRVAGLDSVCRASNRVQPDRADSGAGTAADGGGPGRWASQPGRRWQAELLTGKQLEPRRSQGFPTEQRDRCSSS